MGRRKMGALREKKPTDTNQNRTYLQLSYTKNTHSKEIVRVRKMLDIALAYAVGETKQQLNTMIYGTITIVLC